MVINESIQRKRVQSKQRTHTAQQHQGGKALLLSGLENKLLDPQDYNGIVKSQQRSVAPDDINQQLIIFNKEQKQNEVSKDCSELDIDIENLQFNLKKPGSTLKNKIESQNCNSDIKNQFKQNQKQNAHFNSNMFNHNQNSNENNQNSHLHPLQLLYQTQVQKFSQKKTASQKMKQQDKIVKQKQEQMIQRQILIQDTNPNINSQILQQNPFVHFSGEKSFKSNEGIVFNINNNNSSNEYKIQNPQKFQTQNSDFNFQFTSQQQQAVQLSQVSMLRNQQIHSIYNAKMKIVNNSNKQKQIIKQQLFNKLQLQQQKNNKIENSSVSINLKTDLPAKFDGSNTGTNIQNLNNVVAPNIISDEENNNNANNKKIMKNNTQNYQQQPQLKISNQQKSNLKKASNLQDQPLKNTNLENQLMKLQNQQNKRQIQSFVSDTNFQKGNFSPHNDRSQSKNKNSQDLLINQKQQLPVFVRDFQVQNENENSQLNISDKNQYIFDDVLKSDFKTNDADNEKYVKQQQKQKILSINQNNFKANSQLQSNQMGSKQQKIDNVQTQNNLSNLKKYQQQNQSKDYSGNNFIQKAQNKKNNNINVVQNNIKQSEQGNSNKQHRNYYQSQVQSKQQSVTKGIKDLRGSQNGSFDKKLIIIEDNNFSSQKQSLDNSKYNLYQQDLSQNNAQQNIHNNQAVNNSQRQSRKFFNRINLNNTQSPIVSNNILTQDLQDNIMFTIHINEQDLNKQNISTDIQQIPPKIHNVVTIKQNSQQINFPKFQELAQKSENTQDLFTMNPTNATNRQNPNQQQSSVLQLKKPPQVPSLVTKIQQANQQNPSQELQQFEGVSGEGVSAISTIGGITGKQINQNVTDNYSQNPLKKFINKDKRFFRKNSSILSTANRNQFQINTPSAHGYTSVLLGGANQTAPSPQNFNFYGNFTQVEENELRQQQIIFGIDQQILDELKIKQELELIINPLGSHQLPYMNIELNNRRTNERIQHIFTPSLQEYLTYRQNQMRSRIIFSNIQELQNTISQQNKLNKSIMEDKMLAQGLNYNSFKDWIMFNQLQLSSGITQ